MSRVQLALNVADIDAAVEFYSKLFGAEPAKRRPGYANFAITEPPLKLVLIENPDGRGSGAAGALEPSRRRGRDPRRGPGRHRAGWPARAWPPTCRRRRPAVTRVQDKAWVNDPDGAPWEVYTVLADAPGRDRAGLLHRELRRRAEPVTVGASSRPIVLLNASPAAEWRRERRRLVAAPARRVPRQRLSGRGRRRLGHRRPAALPRQHRPGAARERRRHRRRARTP